MEGKKAHAVAEREAFEEAGVRGRVEKNHFGFFDYDKKLRNGVQVLCRVQVHLLEVVDLVKNFPERASRTLEWVTPQEASRRVNEPELKELFLSFDKQMAQTQQQPPQKIVNL
jgi:8-oxo-dGTP pyrophosphatase MutT (NUDIX family)